MTKNQLMLIVCGLTATLTFILLAIYGQGISSFIDSNSMRPRAVYKNMEISGYVDEFDKILLGYPEQMSDVTLYVELPDHRRFLLRDLPEEIAGKLLEKQNYSFKTLLPENSIDYNIGHTFLTYRDGKLVFAALNDSSCPFRISPNKDGPYVKLPISRETLLEVFGEPLRWEKASPPPSGP